MRRYPHSLSHYNLSTFDMGQLVPVACVEVLPGDTFKGHTSALIRVTPPVVPVMHPVKVRFHWWFVPTRILMAEGEWGKFITGGSDGEGDGVSVPTITADAGTGFLAKSLPDYLGIKPGVVSLNVLAFPVRAYNKIWNERYRDQDLVAAVSQDQLVVQRVAWGKDYFTLARPWPQKGPEVTLPLGTTAPVLLDPTLGGSQLARDRDTHALLVGAPTGVSYDATGALYSLASANEMIIDPATSLYTDLSTATAVSVNDVREAFARQRYEEARAQYGSRLTEYLAYLGIRSSDARLQQPEYVGGGQQTISFSEVLQTGVTDDGDTEGVGNMAGHGIAAMRSRNWMRFFEEHGYLMCVASVRPMSMYMDGLPRFWQRRSKEDWFQPEFQKIGQQEILRREVWAEAGAGGDTVFGYGNRYDEYTRQWSQVMGEFRDSSMDMWHMARGFTGAPTLNSSFIQCVPTDRIYQEQTQNELWCMIGHKLRARRMVQKDPAARII